MAQLIEVDGIADRRNSLKHYLREADYGEGINRIKYNESMRQFHRKGGTSRGFFSQGEWMSFTFSDIRFDAAKLTEEYRAAVNNVMRKHIKDSIEDAIEKVKGKLHYRRRRAYGRPVGEVIGESLNYGLVRGNQHQSDYIVGSYDKDESPPNQPTGIRSMGMKKTDPSLTEIYGPTTSPFLMKGFIGAGSPDTSMSSFVREGERAEWKSRADTAGKLFISEKGYGKGIGRTGKGIPTVLRRGWTGLETIPKLNRQVILNIQKNESVIQDLENIDVEKYKHFQEQTAGTQTTLYAYSNLKGQ